MRKRIFTMIPLVALLASCGSAPDPLAAVAKQLPNDVTPVSKTSEEEQETYSRALNKVMEGITTFDFSKSVYELSLGLNVSVSGSYQGVLLAVVLDLVVVSKLALINIKKVKKHIRVCL